MYTSEILDADFKTSPFDHQFRELETHGLDYGRALLWQMRTGKSKLTIDTACLLHKLGLLDAVIVFAPNGVHENWLRRELPLHHWDNLEHSTLAWRTEVAGVANANESSWISREDRERWRHNHEAWWATASDMLKGGGLTWFAFNSESMTRDDVRRLVARIMRRKGRVLAVFDESQDFRKPGSKRTKMARSVAYKCTYRRILTGTVVTNSPLAAFSQYELLEREALGFRTYKDFKGQYAEYTTAQTRKGRNYPLLDHYKNLEMLSDTMAPWSSIVLREDCPDLPDLVRSTRQVALNDEQTRLYRELHKQFTFELGGATVSIGENTSRLTKLQQVVSGFLIDEFKDVHDVPGVNPRLEALSDEVYLSSGKVIVWCRFREDMDRVANRLTADGHEVVQYHGRTSPDDKARVRELFAPDAENDVKALVGYPTAGLDLSAASHIFNYSHTFDAIKREQADERATAIGGENVHVMDFVAPGVDGYILDNVLNKVSVADVVAGSGMRDALKRMEL